MLLQLHGTNLQGQTEQIDEAFCIVMVIQITGGEGSQVLIVQRVRRSGSRLDDVALVELEFHFTGYIFLGLLDE